MFSVNLRPDEKLFKIYRQTEWVLAKPLLIIFLAIYIPAFLLVKNELLLEYSRFLIFWIFLVLLYGLNHYILWLANSYVVTDRRVIAVIYHSIFKRQVQELPL